VFFDEVRVTPGDVLGTVDDGWTVVKEVLAFERVGIARYARCERLLAQAPVVLGDAWESLPAELRGRWARMLVHCRRARLLAYRVVALQGSGRIRAEDAAAYRIAVTKLDQDSAEVLMDITAFIAEQDDASARFVRAAADHARYSVSSTVASGSIEMQRITLARALLAGA
jgi:alkylation response protein AidB-like acyl-CoA dehydrogenase